MYDELISEIDQTERRNWHAEWEHWAFAVSRRMWEKTAPKQTHTVSPRNALMYAPGRLVAVVDFYRFGIIFIDFNTKLHQNRSDNNKIEFIAYHIGSDVVIACLCYSSFGVNLANAIWPIGRITAETNCVWERTNRIPDGKSRSCILRSHTVVAVPKTKNIFQSSKTTKFVSNKFQCHCRCRRFFFRFARKIKIRAAKWIGSREVTMATATWNAITGHMHLRNKFKNTPEKRRIKDYNKTNAGMASRFLET